MSDDNVRRAGENDSPPQKDRYAEVLRELPRMRSIKTDEESQDKPYVKPPPPLLSRMGAVVQGCGGLLLTLVAVPMVLVAVGYGFYIWGPGLLMTGGVVMLFAVAGLWRGKRGPLLISIGTIIGAGAVYISWGSFLPAAARLAPIGQLVLVYVQVLEIMPLALGVVVTLHLITLYYWGRLTPFTRRHMGVWLAGVTILVALSLASHFLLQQQRQSWLDDHLDTWSGEVSSESMVMGATVNVTLGFSFVRIGDDENTLFDVRQAELEAIQKAGASPIRVGVSGDLLFEKPEEDDPYEARIFKDDNEEELKKRIDDQETKEAEYMALLGSSELFFYDYQSSAYMLFWVNETENLIEWDDFAGMHVQRVTHYAEKYQPAYYEIVTEPSSYAMLSGIEEPDDEDDRLANWVAHTQNLIGTVEQVSPETKIGVTVAVQDDFDLRFYEEALAMDDLDFIGVRIYSPLMLEQLEEMLDKYGQPSEHGKALWITHTWYGFCVAPQRSMELDALWLETVVAFAAKENITGVIVYDHGCFVQKGGTWYTDEFDSAGETEVWRAWRDLVKKWQPEPVARDAEDE